MWRVRLLISLGISVAAVSAAFITFKAAPGYGTMAWAFFLLDPGILIARLFIHSAPPAIPGINYIVAGISLVFYTAVLSMILWLYDTARPK